MNQRDRGLACNVLFNLMANGPDEHRWALSIDTATLVCTVRDESGSVICKATGTMRAVVLALEIAKKRAVAVRIVSEG